MLRRTWTERAERRSSMASDSLKGCIISKGIQEKKSIMGVRGRVKNPFLGITVRHQSASIVVPNSYPRNGFFSVHLALMKDSYNLIYGEKGKDHRLIVFCKADHNVYMYVIN